MTSSRAGPYICYRKGMTGEKQRGASGSMNTEIENSVVKRVLDGDVQAFEFIVRKYQATIYNLMYRVFHDESEAADMAQEAFVRAFSKLDKFRGGRFFSWLYTLSINIARDRLRKRRLSDNLFFVPEDIGQYPDHDDGISILEKGIDVRKLYSIIETLPLGYTEPLLLRYREDLSLKEVSKLTGLSLSGTKMRIHRGLAMVRERLEEEL